MAKLKPIITTQEKLNTIDIKEGQFICVKDSNSIYIDTDTERLEYTLPRVLNYLQSGNSISIGGSNTIQGNGCVVLGNSNTASSDKAFILGQNNTVSGECAVPVIGSGNVLPENATSVVIIGCHSNSLTEIANNCINVGFLNKIIGRGYAYGEGLQTTNDFETALGAYNLSNSDTIFSIGNGTSADNRSNLLTIYKDGKVETNSFIGASITNWQANYSYKINELVIYNNILYQCNINHTSLETFEENKWNILLSAKDDSFNFGDLSTAMTTGTQNGIIVTADSENERFNFEVTGIPTIAINADGYWTINGELGENPTKAQGDKGNDGISPTAKVVSTENGATITIIDKNGETNATISNGTDGTNGIGITSIDKTSSVDNVDTYTITYSDTTTSSFDVTNGITTISTDKIDYTCTFKATDWSSSIPYTQTVNVEGITASMNPRIDIIVSDGVSLGIKEESAFACVTKGITGDGTLTLYCYEEKPTVDMNIMIEVI